MNLTRHCQPSPRPRHLKKLQDIEEEWEKFTIDWGQKTRVFVGNIGFSAFSDAKKASNGGAEGDDEGASSSSTPSGADYSLAEHDATGRFRDALLLYANRRWVHVDKKPPANALSLSLIDFGIQEVQVSNVGYQATTSATVTATVTVTVTTTTALIVTRVLLPLQSANS